MMHPLDGPREKVSRARFQIITLQHKIEAFFRDNLYEVGITEYDPKTDHYILRIKAGPESLPPVWGAVIGEIAHDLRSALDGLAWQLALNNPLVCKPYDRTAFPIYLVGRTIENVAHFHGNSRRRDGLDIIQSIDPKHLRHIESFQPYKRGNGNKSSPLFLLQELNNTDKHRLITVLFPAADSLHFTGLAGHVHLNRRVTLYTNAKIGWLTDVPPNRPGQGAIYTLDPTTGKLSEPKMEVKVDVAPGVRFGDSCDAVERLPVIRTLQRMANEVSRIIESFSDEFPK
jgi:hypothetical protein